MRPKGLLRGLVALLTILAHVLATPIGALAQSEAARAILDAAAKGDRQAQFSAGVIYESGIDVSQNFTTAAEWYAKSAAQDFPPAQVAIGYFHQTGKGVAKDPAKAADWYKRAANSGDVLGQFHLAVAYVNGIGVGKDARLAAEWLFKAAEAGDQQAQLMFATMLQSGSGMKRNEFAARRWFDKAASGPDSDIAGKARTIRAKIDERLLFSGAFRPEEMAILALIGFGLVAMIVTSQGSSDYAYDWQQYQQPQVHLGSPLSSSSRPKGVVDIYHTKPITTLGRVTGSITILERRPIR
jgi:TPR repeat protein